MGKTQDKFIEEQERLINKAVDAFADDDYQYQEYLKSLTPPSKPVTMEEANKEWDDWWNSLTNGRDICNLQMGQAVNGYNFENEEDLNGFNATLNKVSIIPHSKSIKEAWLKTEVAIKSYHVVDRNNSKFSDDKVMRKMAKDFE